MEGEDPEAEELLVPVAIGMALQLPPVSTPEVRELFVHELDHMKVVKDQHSVGPELLFRLDDGEVVSPSRHWVRW